MTVIELRGVCKKYRRYASPTHRLFEILTGVSRHHTTVALGPIDLTVAQGEVVGVIGLNGAGKSTLLKLIAGTLSPTSGEVAVSGRISALLELGTGFHPAMSARENVFLSCAAAGIALSRAKELYADVVSFSGLNPESMQQPIKTFSSGMVARLAFSISTALEPEVLIVDELLSVGDGVFARKSFDRIMEFKRSGKTMFFCSHSMYQIEAICSRVIWLNDGAIMMEGVPAEVVVEYNAFLDGISLVDEGHSVQTPIADLAQQVSAWTGARLKAARVEADGESGQVLKVKSGQTDVHIDIGFGSDCALPCPSIALRISDATGRTVSSMSTVNDGFSIRRDSTGSAGVRVTLPRFPLLKGRYWITVVLLSEDGIHVYDRAPMVAELAVEQKGLEQGIVHVAREWAAIGD